ncbi:MAG: small multi-drug export protein, partial [Bacillota bacterium]
DVTDFLLNEWLSFVSRESLVFFTAMLPVVELRGAIPLGISLGMSPIEACVVSVLGNITPVVPVMVFLRYVAGWFRRFQTFRKASDSLFARTRARSRLVQKYGLIGLVLFVAVPLPSTGAWTAAIAAFLFGIRIRYAFASIALGTVIAGAIVTYLSSHVI